MDNIVSNSNNKYFVRGRSYRMYVISIKKYKVASFILIIIMLSGILTHSVVLWTLNKFYAAANISDIYFRLSMRKFAETIVGTCSIIYFAGNIMLIYFLIKNSPALSFCKLLYFLCTTIIAIFICVIPFALSDVAFLGDYLFPIWNVLAIMLIFFFVVLGSNLIKHRKNRNQHIKEEFYDQKN